MSRRVIKRRNKKVQNATKIEVNGIKFRSKLEEYTHRKLLEAFIEDFRYEVDTFIIQDKIVYPEPSYSVSNKTKELVEDSANIRPITYTPDFVCIDPKTKVGWIIEIKGFANDVFPVKWKLFKAHLVNNGYTVSLFLPRTQKTVDQAINIIKQMYYG